MLGEKVYRSHELTYAGELIRCGHCGHIITGEVKVKKTKAGEREYAYFDTRTDRSLELEPRLAKLWNYEQVTVPFPTLDDT